ncbi:MAG: response regulator [Halobacteriovoraceae bacterium]|jgi:response regulator of citrate/malate metabolism|nr:response regulator [Halobacteriovoraceae bacterium]MBT5094867.1 response regulator [Halobacteriovoraceae bacterium]
MTEILKSKELSVLIVDDEAHICDLLEVMLKSCNLFSSIVSSTSAQVALQKIRNQNFDLIILDNQMPDKMGMEIIEILSQSLRFNEYCIIFMSGAMQNEHAIKAIKLGIKNFLVKPFTRKGLLKAVLKALNEAKSVEFE